MSDNNYGNGRLSSAGKIKSAYYTVLYKIIR